MVLLYLMNMYGIFFKSDLLESIQTDAIDARSSIVVPWCLDFYPFAVTIIGRLPYATDL
jgi:hypothetical protein